MSSRKQPSVSLRMHSARGNPLQRCIIERVENAKGRAVAWNLIDGDTKECFRKFDAALAAAYRRFYIHPIPLKYVAFVDALVEAI